MATIAGSCSGAATTCSAGGVAAAGAGAGAGVVAVDSTGGSGRSGTGSSGGRRSESSAAGSPSRPALARGAASSAAIIAPNRPGAAGAAGAAPGPRGRARVGAERGADPRERALAHRVAARGRGGGGGGRSRGGRGAGGGTCRHRAGLGAGVLQARCRGAQRLRHQGLVVVGGGHHLDAGAAGARACGQDDRVRSLFFPDHAQGGAHVGSGETLDSHVESPSGAAWSRPAPLPCKTWAGMFPRLRRKLGAPPATEIRPRPPATSPPRDAPSPACGGGLGWGLPAAGVT